MFLREMDAAAHRRLLGVVVAGVLTCRRDLMTTTDVARHVATVLDAIPEPTDTATEAQEESTTMNGLPVTALRLGALLRSKTTHNPVAATMTHTVGITLRPPRTLTPTGVVTSDPQGTFLPESLRTRLATDMLAIMTEADDTSKLRSLRAVACYLAEIEQHFFYICQRLWLLTERYR